MSGSLASSLGNSSPVNAGSPVIVGQMPQARRISAIGTSTQDPRTFVPIRSLPNPTQAKEELQTQVPANVRPVTFRPEANVRPDTDSSPSGHHRAASSANRDQVVVRRQFSFIRSKTLPVSDHDPDPDPSGQRTSWDSPRISAVGSNCSPFSSSVLSPFSEARLEAIRPGVTATPTKDLIERLDDQAQFVQELLKVGKATLQSKAALSPVDRYPGVRHDGDKRDIQEKMGDHDSSPAHHPTGSWQSALSAVTEDSAANVDDSWDALHARADRFMTGLSERLSQLTGTTGENCEVDFTASDFQTTPGPDLRNSVSDSHVSDEVPGSPSLEHENQRLKVELKKVKAERDVLSQQVQHWRDLAERIAPEKAGKCTQDEHNMIEQEIQHWRGLAESRLLEIDGLREHLNKALILEVQALQSELSMFRQELRRTQKQRDRLHNEVTSLKGELKAKEEANREALEKVTTLKEVLKACTNRGDGSADEALAKVTTLKGILKASTKDEEGAASSSGRGRDKSSRHTSPIGDRQGHDKASRSQSPPVIRNERSHSPPVIRNDVQPKLVVSPQLPTRMLPVSLVPNSPLVSPRSSLRGVPAMVSNFSAPNLSPRQSLPVQGKVLRRSIGRRIYSPRMQSRMVHSDGSTTDIHHL